MMSILLLFVLILSACGNQAAEKEQEKEAKEKNEPKTMTYQSETGYSRSAYESEARCCFIVIFSR